MKKNPKTLFQRVILVTGGAGFIGSNYLNKFVRLRPRNLFVCVDSLTYAGSLRNITLQDKKNFVFERVDICNGAALRKVFEKYHPSGVIHFAAESHVDRSIQNPALFIETNIIGTNNLLLLSREFGIRRFHHISTDEVYGHLPNTTGVFTEKSPIAPRNLYSASKAGAEHAVFAYYHTFGLPIVMTRSSNNYGPYQDVTKLIPLFIKNLLSGKKVPLYGKGKQIRDWLYVEDNIDAIDLVFRNGRNGEVYNIGGGEEFSNYAVTKILLALAGKGEEAIEFVSDRLGHDFRYALSISKIKKELGWSPRVRFEEGIAKTFIHYKNTDAS